MITTTNSFGLMTTTTMMIPIGQAAYGRRARIEPNINCLLACPPAWLPGRRLSQQTSTVWFHVETFVCLCVRSPVWMSDCSPGHLAVSLSLALPFERFTERWHYLERKSRQTLALKTSDLCRGLKLTGGRVWLWQQQQQQPPHRLAHQRPEPQRWIIIIIKLPPANGCRRISSLLCASRKAKLRPTIIVVFRNFNNNNLMVKWAPHFSFQRKLCLEKATNCHLKEETLLDQTFHEVNSISKSVWCPI